MERASTILSERKMNMKNRVGASYRNCLIICLILMISSLGCSKQNKEQKTDTDEMTPAVTVSDRNDKNQEGKENVESLREDDVTPDVTPLIAEEEPPYQILCPEGMTLTTRFHPPKGYERTEIKENSFAEYLATYPLLPDGTSVHLYNGKRKGRQNDHVAVFDLPLVEDDLQQCADSVIRLYAEYFRKTEQFERMKFHFVSGFCCDYESWMQGKRVSVSGNDVSWVNNGQTGNSDEIFEKYLRVVFSYASTLSLKQESVEKDLEDVEVGDIFIYGGSPGHVVMVLDVCENEDGERAFLLGQGYMPAQQFHVIKNPLHEEDPWYYVKEVTEPFETAEYTFDDLTLRTPYIE